MVENGKLSTEDKSRGSSLSLGRTASNDMIPKAQGPVSKAGYLFERRSGRMLQSWTRRYFTIDGEDLIATTRNPKVCQTSVTFLERVCICSDSRNN
jgi:hypothetical protein